MEKVDALVLNQLADKVFTPERLQAMMTELRKRTKSSKDTQQERINQLNRQFKQIEERQHRLLDVIETGIQLDELTQRRAQKQGVALDRTRRGTTRTLPSCRPNESKPD